MKSSQALEQFALYIENYASLAYKGGFQYPNLHKTINAHDMMLTILNKTATENQQNIYIANSR